MSEELWYQEGLRFSCTQCGNCCTGAPGVVWVNQEELQAIAEFLGQSLEQVLVERTRKVGYQTSLREHANGDCTFFDGGSRRCTIYPIRPRQCRTWPFWNSILESPESWKGIQSTCPGAGKGKLYQIDEIREQASVIDI